MNRSLPRNAGELRRRLAGLGDPWEVDPRRSRDDRLPDDSRGGRSLDEAAADEASDAVTPP